MDLDQEQAKRLAAVPPAEKKEPDRGAVGSGVGSKRRIIARAALCLLFGLFTTVGVAWASVLIDSHSSHWNPVRVSLSGESEPLSGGTFPELMRHRSAAAERVWLNLFPVRTDGDESGQSWFQSALEQIALVQRAKVFPPKWASVPDVRVFRQSQQCADPVSVQDARGWPMLALRCEWLSHGSLLAEFPDARWGIDLEPQYGWYGAAADVRALPYRPIPLGLTLDTLFFAGLWAMLLFAPGFGRRQVRRRRNLCPRCGYSLANLPPGAPCPECGAKPEASA